MMSGCLSPVPLDLSVIELLRDPEAYPHPVESIEILETHVSWVVLTGTFAYKIKKPVKLGFLDFGSLSSRRFYCEEELRLNRRWAPDLYLDVVSICVRDGRVFIGGDGEPVEYAVRMRQFDQSKRLDAQLIENKLSASDMDDLAETVFLRHDTASRVARADRSRILALIESAMRDNLDALDGHLPPTTLTRLRDWTGSELDRWRSVIRDRFDDGFVRECHGDLHLTNLVRLPSGITAFDCLEFSADLRNTDVMADIAFLVMDLVARQRTDLAYRFLNRYLEISGDYGSMQVFKLYFVYRCLVRAKIAVIRNRECAPNGAAPGNLSRVISYAHLALNQARKRTSALFVMHGLSGSGKTWLSTRLMSLLPAIRVRSDIERKRLFGLAETEASGSNVAQGIYAVAANDAVYQCLHELGGTILRAGHDTLLDASYLRSVDREHARELAAKNNAQFVLVHPRAPLPILRDRLSQRAASESDASEARQAVLEHQLETMDPLSPAEQRTAVNWNWPENSRTDLLARQLRRRLPPRPPPSAADPD